MLLLPRNACCR